MPETGRSAFDTLDPEVQAMLREAGEPVEPRPMDAAMSRLVLGDDLSEEQFAWCLERLVPEAPRLTTDPVDLSSLRSSMPRLWVRTLHDAIVPAAKQLRFAQNVGECPVVDLSSGHMCMISQPAALASVLNDVAAA